jgi:hypothetical protein
MLGVTAMAGWTHDRNDRTKYDPSTSSKAQSLDNHNNTLTDDTNDLRTKNQTNTTTKYSDTCP